VTILRISALAERTGIPATTLRYYEGAGLLTAARSAAGYRLYGDDAIQRLQFISSGKLLGLSLNDIRELVALQQSGVCTHVRERLLTLVKRRIGEADRRMAELAAFKTHLARAHQELGTAAPEGACGPACGCLVTTPDHPGRVDMTIGRRPAAPDPAMPSVACTLDGALMGDRIQEWRDLVAEAVAREPLPQGLRLTFPADPDLAARISRLAMDELDCCAFYSFTVDLSPRTLTLTIRAPDEAAGVLSELFGLPA